MPAASRVVVTLLAVVGGPAPSTAFLAPPSPRLAVSTTPPLVVETAVVSRGESGAVLLRRRRRAAAQKEGTSSADESSSSSNNNNNPATTPLPEVKHGEIDWDREWSKVVRGEQDHVARPKEFQLDVQRAQRRVARSTRSALDSTRREAQRFSRQVGSAGSVSGAARWALKQDAKFYLGVLAVVAFLPYVLIALGSLTSSAPADLQSYIV